MVATPEFMKQAKTRTRKPRLLTYDDYARLTPPDNGNYELHNGQIVFMPTPTPAHQLFSANLLVAIHTFVKKEKLGRVLSAPMDTVFSANTTLQPDLLYLSKERLHLIGDKKIEGAPDLVVEILSPSNNAKEMSFKKYTYEISDVLEYWVVNLEKKCLTQYEKVDEELVIRHIFQQNEILTSLVIEGFETEIASLFE